MSTTPSLKATDLLAVRSRVSWGAIAAGAMVAFAVYFLLSILGVALGVEVAARGRDIGAGGAIYALISLLLSMFFGGWAVSRLAVGESKLEAVLYGIILWGVLFAGMIWLVSSGVRVGYGAILGVASGTYTDDAGTADVGKIADDLKRAGVDPKTVDQYRAYAERVQRDPRSAPEVAKDAKDNPAVQDDAREVVRGARSAAWWTLAGVVVSMATVIFGSLAGSGDLPIPVPLLGVRRAPRA